MPPFLNKKNIFLFFFYFFFKFYKFIINLFLLKNLSIGIFYAKINLANNFTHLPKIKINTIKIKPLNLALIDF